MTVKALMALISCSVIVQMAAQLQKTHRWSGALLLGVGVGVTFVLGRILGEEAARTE